MSTVARFVGGPLDGMAHEFDDLALTVVVEVPDGPAGRWVPEMGPLGMVRHRTVAYRLDAAPDGPQYVSDEKPARPSVHACSAVCGLYLHRCEFCGYEGAFADMAPTCPGCAYRSE